MKKFLSLLLIFAVIFSLAACTKQEPEEIVEPASVVDPNKITIVDLTPTSNIIQKDCFKLCNLSGNILGEEDRYEGWSYYYYDSNIPTAERLYWKTGSEFYTSFEILFDMTNLSNNPQLFKDNFKGYVIHNAPDDFDYEKAFEDNYVESFLSKDEAIEKRNRMEIFKVNYLQDNPKVKDENGKLLRSIKPMAVDKNNTAKQVLLADVSYSLYYNYSGEFRDNPMFLLFTYGNNVIFRVNLKTTLKEST